MKTKMISLALIAIMVISSSVGCSGQNNFADLGNVVVNAALTTPLSVASETASSTTSIISVSAITEKLKDEDSDSSWNASSSTQIRLNGTTATVSGNGELLKQVLIL